MINKRPRISNDKRTSGGDRRRDYNSSFGNKFTDRRDDRRESTGRDSKPSFGRREDRPSFERGRDGGFRSSFDRDTKQNKDTRGAFGRNRDERPSFEKGSRSSFDRDTRQNKDTRGAFGRNRDERPSFEKGSRSSFGRNRNERGERTEGREFGEKRSFRDKPSSSSFKDYRRRDERSSYGERDKDNKDRRYSERRDYDKAYDKRREPQRKSSREEINLDEIRLNRFISNAGVCSRRQADELISLGEIKVNGEVITELGYKVQRNDRVHYGSQLLRLEKMVYILLNKPKDYITTTNDPHERKTVMELVEKATQERVYPVGRLDRNTTGLLLLTNDGDLAEKLSHPRNNVSKLYHVFLNKSFRGEDMNKLTAGLQLEDGFIQPDEAAYANPDDRKEVGIRVHSGKNRIVRRMFEHLGYDVEKLDRVMYADLTKKDLPRGRCRHLTEAEIRFLKKLAK